MNTTAQVVFKKAQKKNLFLVLGIAGPSGSGKTYSALELAKGLLGGIPMTDENVALIDTEHGSGSLYADRFNYAVNEIEKPYTPEKYQDAIMAAQSQKFKVLIIDSLTHAWSGQGGLLDIQAAIAEASRSSNSYTAWRKVTPKHNALIDAILSTKMHVIVTLRSKQAYAIVNGNNGKTDVKKLGVEPIFREGFEFETSIFMELNIDGNLAIVTKDRSSLFANNPPFKITSATGKKIKEWLESGVNPREESQKLLNNCLTVINKTSESKYLAILWEEMTPLFKDLESDHLEILIKAKDNMKVELSQSKKETSKVTPIKKIKSKVNNSKKQYAL